MQKVKKCYALLILLTLSINCYSIDVRTYVPSNAKTFLPVLKKEVDTYLPDFKFKPYFGSLIEQESCISLTHRRCWRPDSELRTSKEQGVGLGQITRAFRPDGSTRFDSLTDMKNKYKADLKELSWDNVKTRPDLQIRLIIFMVRDLHKQFFMINNDYSRLAFVDSAYNGGSKLLMKERTLCGLSADCDPHRWFGHVEKFNSRGTRVLYGKKTAFDINREHVFNVLRLRYKKYEPYMV